MFDKSKCKFIILLLSLSVIYALWLTAFWPGVLGQDSLAVILEVESNRSIQANKPAFWFLFNDLLYGPWRLVETPIIIQSAITILVLARILNWMLDNRQYKSFLYCLFFIALAPSVLYYSTALYSDGIYTISLIGMLFEIWLSFKSKNINRTSMAMMFITIPFALFARPNGLINTLAIISLFFALHGNNRWKLALIAIPWCVLGIFATTHYKYDAPMGSIFPLALYETVGFLEHRPMGLWEHNQPRITEKSVAALTSNGATLELISKYYDHYYWDPLIFSTAGPALSSLSPKAKKTIVREFFKYNLWHNFPAFMASRVNVFLYAAMANGGIPPPESADYILGQTKSRSQVQFRDTGIHHFFLAAYNFTLKYRALFWAPWLGLFLTIATTKRALQLRDKAGLLICSILTLQLAAIFFFSIAGEYRYLLTFFIAPLVLLPILNEARSTNNISKSIVSREISATDEPPQQHQLNQLSLSQIGAQKMNNLFSFSSRFNLKLSLTAVWLTWMLVAATKRMIRFFPAPEAPLNNDAYWTYLPNAKNLLKAPWYFLTQVEDSFYVAPLGYVWPAIWGADHVTTQLANCTLFLLSIVLMWRLATRLGGLLAGMVATALLVFYPDLTSFVTQVLTESLYLFSLLLLLTCITEYVLSPSSQKLWLALAAIGLTLSLLSRPVLQIFVLALLILVIVGLWFRRRRKAQPFQGWGLLINGSVAIALVSALVLPAAVVLKNGVYFHFWGLGTGAGSGLYYGTSPFKMGVEPVYGGFAYDASVVPFTADPSTKGHPLKPQGDAILSRVALSTIKNTSLVDNIGFFYFKLKTWLFFGQEELRMRPLLRTLRTFEWVAILSGVLLVIFSGFRNKTSTNSSWELNPNLSPNADGFGKRRLVLFFMLLLLTLGMAFQLTPVLYNIRYSMFFLEPTLMVLSGVSVAMLLRSHLGGKKRDSSARGVQWVTAIKWIAPRIIVIAMLVYIPIALTKHAVRHRTWAMDPLRPGPTEILIDPTQMGPVTAANATPAGTNQWTTTQRPAVLSIPFQIDAPTSSKDFLDGIWRFKVAVKPPHEDRNCKNVRMELTTPSPEELWYVPEPLVHVRTDGDLHLYAIRENGALRPLQSGEIKLTFNCPSGTQITWGNAQFLKVTIHEAARALIVDGTPVNPYRPDDIK